MEVGGVQGRHDGAAVSPGDKQPLPFEPAQRLPDGNEAHAQLPGDLPQRELLTRPQRPRPDRPGDLVSDLVHHRLRGDRADERFGRQATGHNSSWFSAGSYYN